MKKGLGVNLIFIVSQYNKNSLNALFAALGKQAIDGLEIKLIKQEEISAKLVDCLAIQERPCVIAWSFTSIEFERIRKKIKSILDFKKRGKTKTILIAGGPHPSGNPASCIKAGFDYCFVGEGEKSFPNFITKIIDNELPRDRIIPGTRVDINEYACVAKNFPFFVPIEITRGCPFGCKYCQTSYLFGPYRHRTLKKIIEGVRLSVKKGYHRIRFLTPNGLAYPSLEELLAKTKEVEGVEKIYLGNFPSELWPGHITESKLRLLRKYVDNSWITIGAQTGSIRLLKKMHRLHGVEQVKKATQLALKVGFNVNLDFIFGLPEETTIDLKLTKKFIQELLALSSSRVRIHAHYFLPLPGTPWAEKKPTRIPDGFFGFLTRLEKSGLLYGDWRLQIGFSDKIFEMSSNDVPKTN